MEKTIEKIITIFQSLEAFVKMMDAEKYTIQYGYKYQFGGNVIEVFKNGESIHRRVNLVSKTISKIVGYNFIMDSFLKEHNIQDWESMQHGSLHVQLGRASRNIILPGELPPTDEQLKAEQEQEDRENAFAENWNRMVTAIQKYQ